MCAPEQQTADSIGGEVASELFSASLLLAFAEIFSRAYSKHLIFCPSPPLPSPFFFHAYGFALIFRAGASKQFANLCGIFFASVSWACLVGDKSIGARIMLVSSPAAPLGGAD